MPKPGFEASEDPLVLVSGRDQWLSEPRTTGSPTVVLKTEGVFIPFPGFQDFGDLELFFQIHGSARRLLAVAHGGVEYGYSALG